jgi:uncharacterized protein involved in outer membrane biogenesis
VVLVLIVGWFALSGLVRRAVETAATNSLRIKTTVGGAALSPLGGSVGLTDLTVGSPTGFSSPQMFSLGRVGVTSGIGQLFGDPVRISHVTITAPQLTIEQAGGKLNVMALTDNMKSGESKPADPNAKPMKLVIDQLDLSEASVTIVPGIPGVEKQYQIKLPTVSLKNIGNADGTQTGDEIGRVVNQMVAALAAKAKDSDQLPPQVRQLLSIDVDRTLDQLKGRASEEIERATEKLGGLDKLLDGRKKK